MPCPRSSHRGSAYLPPVRPSEEDDVVGPPTASSRFSVNVEEGMFGPAASSRFVARDDPTVSCTAPYVSRGGARMSFDDPTASFMIEAVAASATLGLASQNFDDDLECPICFNILVCPVTCGVCPHPFCRVCLEAALVTSGSCPMCRSPATRDTLKLNQAAQRAVAETEIACERNCGWVGRRGDYTAHGKECPIAQIAEFTVRIEGQDQHLVPELLGVTFDLSDSERLVIARINAGPVANYNASLPPTSEHRVRRGQQVVEVNGFRGSPVQLAHQLKKGGEHENEIVLRRPQVIRVTMETGGASLGSALTFTSRSHGLCISNIHAGGFLYEFNKSQDGPGQQLLASDRIVDVGGIRGDSQVLIKAMKEAKEHGVFNLTIHRLTYGGGAGGQTSSRVSGTMPRKLKPFSAGRRKSSNLHFAKHDSMGDVPSSSHGDGPTAYRRRSSLKNQTSRVQHVKAILQHQQMVQSKKNEGRKWTMFGWGGRNSSARDENIVSL